MGPSPSWPAPRSLASSGHLPGRGPPHYDAPMTPAGLTFDNRITRLLGVEIPVVQAPMGWIARSRLASAVSSAGGLGIIETSSGELDAFVREVGAMRELTSRPFGVNIAQNLVRDDSIIDVVVDAGVRFVTTSAGDPNRFTTRLKAAGLTVFHVVPTLRGALKAVDAGVEGLVVEGIEGGGFKTPEGASTMVLLPLIRSQVDVPIIAAGGVVDGRTMAAAFVLGAEGVQLGTRFVASVESPVHDNWKQAIVDTAETGTVLLNRFAKPGMRALRTERTSLTRTGMSRDRIQHQPCGSDELATCRASPGQPGPSSAIHACAYPIAKAQCLFFRPEARLLAR